jgi:ankyrin repeat protein
MNKKICFLTLLLASAFPLFSMEEPPAKKQRLEKSEQEDLDKQFLKAAQKGNLSAVQELLKKGADVNTHTTSKGTALHYAAANGYADLVKMLVENGANIKAEGKIGIKTSEALAKLNGTALHYAVLQRNEPIVKYLLAQGADSNAIANIGTNRNIKPLDLAITNNDISMVKILLYYKAEVLPSQGSSPLYAAIKEGSIPLVKLLFSVASSHATRENWDIFLNQATHLKNLEIAQLILNNDTHACGTNTCYKRSIGNSLTEGKLVHVNTILVQAIKNGWLEIVKELLLRGAILCNDIEEFEIGRRFFGGHQGSSDSPKLNTEAVHTFLGKVFDDQPLSLAALLNDLEQIKSLIKNATPRAKEIALLHAASQLHTDSALYLLGHEANPQQALDVLQSLEEKQGPAPVSDIKHKMHLLNNQLIRRLPLAWQIVYKPKLAQAVIFSRRNEVMPVEVDLKLNPTGILLDALSRGDLTYVSLALKAGANPNAKNLQGTPAAALAALCEDTEKSETMVTELLKYKAILLNADLLLYLLCKSPDAAQRKNTIKLLYIAAHHQGSSLSPETKTLCKTMLNADNE